jgi:hypothetical protein
VYGKLVGESDEVFIKVDKIREITFEGPPS